MTAIHGVLAFFFTYKLAYGKPGLVRTGEQKKSNVFRRSLYGVLAEYLVREQKLVLFISKIISLVFLYTAFADNTWGSGIRGLSFIILFVSLAHCSILYVWYKFREERLGFSCNLPISYQQDYLGILLPCILLLMPEILFLLGKGGLLVGLCGILLLFSLVLLFWSLLEYIGTDIKKYFKYVLAVGFLLYFLFLYNLAGPVALVAFFITGRACYRRFHLEKDRFSSNGI